MKIETLKLTDLQPYEKNARTHPQKQVDLLAKNIMRFGFTTPVLIDEKNNVIAGHGRLLALQQLGEPNVPCVRMSGLTKAEVAALRLADNKIAEMGEWDMDLALPELKGLDADLLDLTGFSADLLVEPDEKDDVVPENAPPVAKLGDLWALGEHRVLCGDSTDLAQVERLMDGREAILCLTDPPYGLGEKKKSGKNDYSVFDDTLENVKNLADLWVPIVRKMCKVVVFSPGVTRQWIYPEPNWVICWFYGGGQLRSPWGFNCWQPFLCYGKDPSLASRNGARPDAINMNTPANGKDLNHPCPKPLKLWEWFIDRLSFSKNDLIFDPFLGSGTTVIACEKTHRICYGMELDPKYVDVILKRYIDYTGGDAVRLSDGKKWSDLCVQKS